MIIERPGLLTQLSSGRWSLVYGRRKTGKTFLVREFTKYDVYYFVRRDRTIMVAEEWREISQETFEELLKRDLAEDRTVVIDEFHRLGGRFLDLLHSMDIKGVLVLVSSTLHMSRSLINSSSPLLGKVSEVIVPLIDYNDLLRATGWTGKKGYEMLAFMTEPTIIGQGYRDPVDAINATKLTVPALVGEVFNEEGRKLTRVYEGILRAVAVGRSTSGEISSFLFSRGLIGRDDPSQVQQYLSNLMKIGILKRIKVYDRNRNLYRHVSPLAWCFYLLDERYGISEREVSRRELGRMKEEIMPRIMEDVLRDALAREIGARSYIDLSPDGEVDGILVKFKRPYAVIEVKWSKRMIDLSEACENLFRIKAKKRYLIVPDKGGMEFDGVDIIEPADIPGIRV